MPSQRRDLDPGTTLIAEGEIGDSYYVIGRGEFTVTREDRDLGSPAGAGATASARSPCSATSRVPRP